MSAQKTVAKGKAFKNRSSVAARMEKQQQQRRGQTSSSQEMNYSLLLPPPPAPTLTAAAAANTGLEEMLKSVGASLTAATAQPFGAGPVRTSGRGKANQRLNNQQVPSATYNKSSSPTKPIAGPAMPNYFGVAIPELIMEDLLFRFINNIPENEKTSHIRVCFQIEQAHWFYVDFYCSSQEHPDCRSIGFKEFVRQVFYNCDYLQKWKNNVESIIEEFRFYKSNVPTYGLVLLDSTLNYVLLVQGYFASKNNWGFPKGKVNEEEMPMQCAIREVLEEVNFDATDSIVSGIRPLQCFLNDTLMQLYIATDVPMDHNFQPHLRKEIRKISWFSVWDLPKDKFDEKACAKLGLTPNNFYTVLPFVNDIRNFIRKEQAKRQKLQPKVTILRKDSSAFQPVIPRANSQQSQLNCVSPSLLSPSCSSSLAQLAERESRETSESVFKPVIFDATTASQPASFTGTAFLDKFMEQKQQKAATLPQTPTSSAIKTGANSNVSTPKSSNPPAPIGSESKSRRKEIKQPKPVHSSLIINVYQAPPDTPPPSSPSTTKNNRNKNYGPFFDQPSTSSASPSMQQPSQAQTPSHKNVIGAVGQVVNESQRSKLRQSHEKQQRNSLQSHNLGISVDLDQLFNRTKDTDNSKKVAKNVEESVPNPGFMSPPTGVSGVVDFSTPPPVIRILRREDGKGDGKVCTPAMSSLPVMRETPVLDQRKDKIRGHREQPKQPVSSSASQDAIVFDFTGNGSQQVEGISTHQDDFFARQSSSNSNAADSLVSTSVPRHYYPHHNNDHQAAGRRQIHPLLCIHLCKAWQHFKIDRSRLILPF